MTNGYRRSDVTGAALSLLLCCASSAEAAEPVMLAPISPWNVEWSSTACSLRRAFGTKEKPSVLIIERYGPTDHFQLTVISDEFKTFQQGDLLRLKFGEGEARRISTVAPGETSKGTATLFFANQSLAGSMGDGPDTWSPPVTPATEAAAKTISVSRVGRERVFATGALDKPFEALRKCTDDLVASWGLDPKQQAGLSKRPEPLASPATWLRPNDYPPAMLNLGKQAIVNFRLTVDAQGAATACEIQRSYNDKKFDEVTCAILMRRARFSPALDAKGQAAPSYYLNTVRWII